MKKELSAICVSTVKTSHLRVLMSSIQEYIPRNIEVYINYCQDRMSFIDFTRNVSEFTEQADNFGEAYNFIVKKAFQDGHDHVIVCNDDIVFSPDSFEKLSEDFQMIHETHDSEEIGWLGCLTNHAIGMQNVRRNQKIFDSFPEETLGNLQNHRENFILPTSFIAPICSAISQRNWVDFLPINYFSDNLQCHEMNQRGMTHFISTAYVHHAGSQSMNGSSVERQKALEILKKNYPEKYKFVISEILGMEE